MKAVVQRVARACVRVDGHNIADIGCGALVLLAIERGDTERDADTIANKLAVLRMFAGRTPMDRSLLDVAGQAIVVSQFTLAGTVSRGRRPSFDAAEVPARAQTLYEYFVERLRALGIVTQTGRFAAHMDVELVNDGPVTFLLDAKHGVLTG